MHVLAAVKWGDWFPIGKRVNEADSPVLQGSETHPQDTAVFDSYIWETFFVRYRPRALKPLDRL